MDRTLIEALRDPRVYPHPAAQVELVETHISWVLLAAELAYKVKKPVKLPFVDFSTLEARRESCHEELRLNRRSAPDLYLDVVPIGGSPAAPRVGAEPAIEYAVKMRRFPQEHLLARIIANGVLQPAHIDALAAAVSAFHAGLPRASVPADHGSAASILAAALENFDEIRGLEAAQRAPAQLLRLHHWTLAEHRRLAAVFEQRRRDGFVRECHGDLHPGNVVMIEGCAVLFDAIEFSAALRWTDVMADVAFAFMEISQGVHGRLAWRFLDRYLEATGDHEGAAVLRFYAVYRAMVRAKVAAIRLGQLAANDARAQAARREFDLHLNLASRLAARGPAALLVMHGVSGSGKTTVSGHLVEALGAIRLRSDVERKRLHGVALTARSFSELGQGMYSPEAGERTYERLERLARGLLEAGYPVVIDASFLEPRHRDAFRLLARRSGAGFHIVSCLAAEETLRRRVWHRAALANDASEAEVTVLESQLSAAHALTSPERSQALMVNTGAMHWQRMVESFARRLHAPAAGKQGLAG